MLWSHFGSSHRIYSNRFFVCQLIWLENWSPALLQGHYGGSFYDMGLIFQFCCENLSKQKKKRKIKRLHVLFKFIYHRKLYTPIDRVFSSWLLWFSFSKILLSKNVCCCIYGILLRVFCPTVRWKRLEFSNFMMHENLQEHSQSRKDLVWTVIRFTLDSWLIFLDCNMFYLEY